MEGAEAKVPEAAERVAAARVVLMQALMRAPSWGVEVPPVDSRAVEAVPREEVGAVMTVRFGQRKSEDLLKRLGQRRGRRSPTAGVAVAAVLLALTETAKKGPERVVEVQPWRQ